MLVQPVHRKHVYEMSKFTPKFYILMMGLFFFITENLPKKRPGHRKVVNFKNLEKSNKLKMHIMVILTGSHKLVRMLSCGKIFALKVSTTALHCLVAFIWMVTENFRISSTEVKTMLCSTINSTMRWYCSVKLSFEWSQKTLGFQGWKLSIDSTHHWVSDFGNARNLQFVLAHEVLTLTWASGRVLISTPGISSTEVKTTLNSNKQYHRKVLPGSFYLNGHTLGFHPQTQKLEPPCTA